jgi:hypothetical protein
VPLCRRARLQIEKVIGMSQRKKLLRHSGERMPADGRKPHMEWRKQR